MGGAAVASVTIATEPRRAASSRHHSPPRRCSVAAKPSWWPSRAAPTRSRSSTCSARSGPALALSLSRASTSHHGLRPEADAEAESSRRLCDRLGVACHVERVTVRQGPPWDGLEAESRRARHARARRARRAPLGATRIATGHTADDQAETVLMRLLQGAGPRGPGRHRPGARAPHPPADRDAPRRRSWRTSARAGSRWVEDASNRDPRFLRNRIRHDVLPFLAELTGASVVEALCRSAAAGPRAWWPISRRGRAPSSSGWRDARAGRARLRRRRRSRRRPLELAAEMLRQAAARLGETRPLRGRRPARAAPAARRAARPRRRGAPGPARAWSGAAVAARRPAGAARARSRARVRVPGVLELPEIGVRLDARVLARARRLRRPARARARRLRRRPAARRARRCARAAAGDGLRPLRRARRCGGSSRS